MATRAYGVQIPTTLADWNGHVIERLAAMHVNEDTRFDFKSRHAVGKTPKQYDRLSESVAAFANRDGGFLVFGVEQTPTGWVFAGMDMDLDFNMKFHQRLDCDPSINCDVAPPLPHPTQPGKFAYVVRVPRSPAGPHSVLINDRPAFYVRTSKGNTVMTHNEIVQAIVASDERRQRLRILEHELKEVERLGDLHGTIPPGSYDFELQPVEVQVLRQLLVELHGLFVAVPPFIECTSRMLRCSAALNLTLQAAISSWPPGGDMSNTAKAYWQKRIAQEGRNARSAAKDALSALQVIKKHHGIA